MSKIGLTLENAPVHGKQLSFRAPCSSFSTECLVINGADYTVVDAAHNNLAGIEGIWNADSIVSVILDTSRMEAYMQNPAKPPQMPESNSDSLTKIDFSGFDNGSISEVMESGEIVIHEVAFDESRRPVSIDGIEIDWGDSDPGPVESTEYPGCHYRTVNGEKEWINPPMIAGDAYRTQERYNGNPVYMACVQHTKATGTNGTTTVHQKTLMLAAAPHIVSLSGVVSNAYGEAYPSSKYGDLKTSYYEGELCIDYNVTEAMPESTVDIIVKFTLD